MGFELATTQATWQTGAPPAIPTLKNLNLESHLNSLTYPDVLSSIIDKPLIDFVTDTNCVVLFAQVCDELQLFQTKNLG